MQVPTLGPQQVTQLGGSARPRAAANPSVISSTLKYCRARR